MTPIVTRLEEAEEGSRELRAKQAEFDRKVRARGILLHSGLYYFGDPAALRAREGEGNGWAVWKMWARPSP